MDGADTSRAVPYIELRAVTRDNWRQCVGLKVAEDQRKFVAPNVHSLAMAAYEDGLQPRAVYNRAGEMVGFIMYGWWNEKDSWWIVRVMVDENHQGHGYGRAAVLKVLNIVEQERPGKEVGLDYDPGNDHARAVYAALGFKETAEEMGDEIIARRPAQTSSAKEQAE